MGGMERGPVRVRTPMLAASSFGSSLRDELGWAKAVGRDGWGLVFKVTATPSGTVLRRKRNRSKTVPNL